MSPPFALLCVVDASQDTINDILWEGHSAAGVWYFWLATQNYSDAPEKKPNEKGNEGTPAPIDSSFKSDFLRNGAKEAAEWIRTKPESVDLDSQFFVILDRRAEKDKTVVVCRISDEDGKGDQLNLLRLPAKDAALHLAGADPDFWDDVFDGGSGTVKIEY